MRSSSSASSSCGQTWAGTASPSVLRCSARWTTSPARRRSRAVACPPASSDSNGQREHQPVRPAAGRDAAVHVGEQRHDQPVLGAWPVVHDHVDLASGARQPAHQHVRHVGAQPVPVVVRSQAEGVREHDLAAGGPERGLEGQRAARIAAGRRPLRHPAAPTSDRRRRPAAGRTPRARRSGGSRATRPSRPGRPGRTSGGRRGRRGRRWGWSSSVLLGSRSCLSSRPDRPGPLRGGRRASHCGHSDDQVVSNDG